MIVDLLAHRAGLPGNGGDTILVIGYDRPFAKKALGLIKPVTSFRSTYAYSNLLYLFPEDLMKKYWGKTWEEGLRERLLAPLGMSASSADLASFRTAANAAHQHTRRPNGEVASIPMDHPSLSFAYTAGPAGGINSNVLDMAKWLRFNLNQGVGGGRQLVSQESLAYIHSPKTIIAPGLSYAQGWLYQEGGPVLAIWHNGDTGGHHSVVAFVPQARVGIVVLSNLGGDNSLPEALMSRFLSQYLGRPEKDYSAEMLAARRKAKEEEKAKAIKKPDLPSPPLPMKAYAGRYGNDICGQIKVGEKDGRLSLKVGLSDEDLILRPWDRDTFEAFIPPFNDEMGLVSFSLTGGLVTSVKIEEFAKDVCGEFVRIE
jgi:CubicO group peptidase (beta-lactamase class C family)